MGSGEESYRVVSSMHFAQRQNLAMMRSHQASMSLLHLFADHRLRVASMSPYPL